MAAFQRDPVSVLFDDGARRFLDAAYARKGMWVTTRLRDPEPRHLAYLASIGIDPMARDSPSAQGGTGLNARTRWARGFVRAVYYQHKWWSATGGGFRAERRAVARSTGGLQVEVGRRVPGGPQAGTVPGPGQIIRARLVAGGQAKQRAVQRLPDSRRIFTGDGAAAARWSDPELRDW